MGAKLAISSYRLTTIRTRGESLRRRYEVCLFGAPKVGEPLVMYGNEDDLQIVTSRIVRMFRDIDNDGTFIETENTLYHLCPPRSSAPA